MSKLRVGVVGLGKMGLLHSALLSRHPDAEVVCAADPDPSRREAARGLGLRAALSADALRLVETAEIDAVVVAAPTAEHEGLARAALSRGLALFVEKPASLGGASTRALLAQARACGGVAAAGYFMRFHPLFARAAALLPSLGAPLRYEALVAHSEALGPAKGWLFSRARGGGVLRNPASHALDWLLQAFGPATVRSARVERRRLIDAEDYVEARLEHAGASGRLVADWTAPGHPTALYRVEVEGPGGRLIVEPERLTHAPVNGAPLEAGLDGGVGFDLAPAGGFGAAYWAESSAFVRACKERRSPANGLEQAALIETLVDDVLAAGEARGS